MRYFDLLKRRAEVRRQYLGRLDYYRREIESFFKERLGSARVNFFGSVLTGRFDAESDVDVLVVSAKTPLRLDERSKLLTELRLRIGFVNPFEIHLITKEEYENWYRKFLNPNSIEVELP